MTRRPSYRRFPTHRRREAAMPASLLNFEMRKIFFAVIGGFLLMYVGFQLYGFFAPPMLTLDTPTEGMKWARRSIEVLGHTIPGVQVSVNGGTVSLDDAGKFKALLVLGDGINTISVRAQKRYGRARTVTRTILVEDKVSLGPSDRL